MEKFMYYTVKIVVWGGLTIAILAIIPTTAILATWNTLPGEKLYPLKRNLEISTLKLFTGNFAMTADLQSQFLDQRFNESQVLLAQAGSNDGLISLTQEIEAAKTEIIVASNVPTTKTSVKSVVVQKKAEKLVIQLKEYNKKLETTPSTPSTSTTVENSANVQQAQVEIQAAIVELEKVVVEEKQKATESSPSITPSQNNNSDKNKNQNIDNKDKKDNEDKKENTDNKDKKDNETKKENTDNKDKKDN